MPLQYSVYGNCQAAALAKCLDCISDFKNKYKYVRLKAVQRNKLSDINLIESKFSKLDLLIYQHISDDYKIPELATRRLLNFLPNNAISISIPSLYFNAYFPHLSPYSQLHSITNFVHDYNIMAGYVNNIPADRLYNIIKSIDFYSQEEVNNFVRQSIFELEKREASSNVDIPISQFISKFYKKEKLFNQFNHPTGFIFIFLVSSILKILNISFEDSEMESIKVSDPLGAVFYPIYPSTAYHLDLKFSNDFTNDKVQGIQDKKYSYLELVHAFYDCYNSYDNSLRLYQIIEKNKPFVLNKMNEFI